MVYVINNIVTFGASVVILQALMNTFIAVQGKKEIKQVRGHEEKRHNKVLYRYIIFLLSSALDEVLHNSYK